MNTNESEQIFTEELYRLPKRVLVLIPIPWESMEQDQIVQLRKILSYVNLTLEGVQILHYSEVEIANLAVFNPTIVLSFETSLTPSISRYELHSVNDIRVISSALLGSLEDSEKRSLMAALNQAFKE